MSRVTFGSLASARWTPDVAAIEAALASLGIEEDVHIQVQTGRYTNGRYAGFRRGPWGGAAYIWGTPRHVVTVHKHLTAERASRTLWHELTHVMQCVRDYGSDHVRFFTEYGDALREVRAYSVAARTGVGGNARYRSVPWEAEAEDIAELMSDCPLLLTSPPRAERLPT